MIFLTVIFIGLSIISVVDFLHSRYKNLIYTAAGILLICIAAFRGPGVDRDYSNYLRLFNMNLIAGHSLTEPSFIFISDFVHRFLSGNPLFLFLAYAAIGVVTKFIAIRELSTHVFLSLVVYFSYSFILHEMTQIRAGVAVGFVLLAIEPLYKRHAAKFFFFASLALFFHYSAIIVYFMWFLKPGRINAPLYAALIVGSYIVFFATNFILTDMVSFLPQGEVVEKIARYEAQNGKALNIFNGWQLLRCILAGFFLYKADAIAQENKYGYILIKMYVLAAVTFVLLAPNPTISTRISDLFSIVDIVLLPAIAAMFKPKVVGWMAVIVIASFYLILNLYFNKIIS